MPKRCLTPERKEGRLNALRFSSFQTKGISFKEHIEKGLADFLGKRDYPDSDRDLIARILVAKGFFVEKEAKDFGIKGFDEKTLDALKGVAKKEKKKEGQLRGTEKLLTFKELAALDPYGIRQLAHTKLGEEFLKNKPERKEKSSRRKAEKLSPLKKLRK